MTWVAWRQHRWVLAGFAALFLALAAVFLLAELAGNSSIAVWEGRSVGGVPGLLRGLESLNNGFAPLAIVVGMLAGAPLLAAEFEHGTYRYSWTQGVSRNRWLATKTLMVGGAVVLLSLVFAAVHAWWFAPFGDARQSWFEATGQGVLVLPANSLFSFALGVAAGGVIRRIVPAMAAVVLGSLVALAAERLFLRPHFAPTDLDPAGRFWDYQFVLAGTYAGLALCCFAVAAWSMRSKLG